MPSRKNIHVVDTNVILRYLLADHETHYRRASEFMAEVRSATQMAYIPESVLAECVYVLLKVYRVPRAEVTEKLADLLGYKGIVAENRELLRKALRHFAENNVDIVDALVFSVAQQRGWKLFSFDRDLKKLTGQHGAPP